MSRKTYHYQNPATYTRLLRYFTWTCIAYTGSMILCFLFLIFILYTKDYISYETIGRLIIQNQTAMAAIGYWITIIFTICHMIVIIFVSLWTYRATANTHALIPKLKQPHYASPGLAVAYYFIPIINIFCPRLTMLDLWEKNLALNNDKREEDSGIVQLWWVGFVVFVILASYGKYYGEHNIINESTLKTRFIIGIAFLTSYLISALSLIRITRTISQAQQTYATMRPAPNETRETP